jgi:hypothetical protein
VRTVAVAVTVALAGCAQLLGLDDTNFDYKDAPTDAPSVCDPDPGTCTSSNGRTVCGRLIGTGERAGLPVRVPDPMGAACLPGNTVGPCAFSVAAMPLDDFFAGEAGRRRIGSVDDCGRFVVRDLDATEEDFAVTFDAVGFNKTATLVVDRPRMLGIDTGIVGLAVAETTVQAWASQLNPGSPPDLRTGYLVRYTQGAAANGPAARNMRVARTGSNALTSAPGDPPWAAYFGGTTPLAAIDPSLTSTDATGLAYADLSGNSGSGSAFPASIDGVRATGGSRCEVPELPEAPNLGQVTDTLIYVIVVKC